MFRNVESRFASVPNIDIERSTFDRPSELKTSGNFADLIPIYAEEILPGDTVRMTTSKVIRLQTLITPVMDNAFLDVFWFFVPNRLVWNNWKKFMGETVYPDGAWVQTTQYTVPSISSPSGGFSKGSLADYFGLPLNLNWSNTDKFRPMALPFRCYALIANEFFRDENLTDPLNIPTSDANQTGTNGSNYINDVANGGMPFKVAKIHDMFTSCLPAPQRSQQPVTFPLISGHQAPVITQPTWSTPSSGTPLKWYNVANGNIIQPTVPTVIGIDESSGHIGDSMTRTGLQGTIGIQGIAPVNLFADLSKTVGAVTVNELRLAFQLQRFYERSARAGSRYTETIRSFFGVTSPDARLQRPEYLGGNRIPININEVTNSAQSSGEPLGDLGAKSHTSDVNYDFEHSFTEHGWLIGLMCARTDHTYSQGIDQKWLRKTTFDYYFPPFAHVGEMPIYKVSIYADHTTMTNQTAANVFGYNEAWIEYRAKNNKATGEMRTSASGVGLGDVWTFGDYYSQAPTLSDSWIREDPNNVDRTLAVQMSQAHQFFADIYFDSTWTRPMPVYSVPGLIDHF